MKMSLLEIVQSILNDMNSDFANSIVDTEESLQVASIVKDTYYEMMNRRDWPHLQRLVPLESANDVNRPTMLLCPKGMKKLDWLNYSTRKELTDKEHFAPVDYLYPDEFIQYTNGRNTDDVSVIKMKTLAGVTLNILNNKPPKYWSSFDDETVVFDSYVKEIEDTIQGSKVQASVYILPEWVNEDSFIPDLPANLFPALLSEAKSTCFYTIKSVANAKAEQISDRQQAFLSSQGWKLHGGIRYPDYGRRGAK